MSVQWVKVTAGNYHAKRDGETVACARYDHGNANDWMLEVFDDTPMIRRNGEDMRENGYSSLAMCKSIYESKRKQYEAIL